MTSRPISFGFTGTFHCELLFLTRRRTASPHCSASAGPLSRLRSGASGARRCLGKKETKAATSTDYTYTHTQKRTVSGVLTSGVSRTSCVVPHQQVTSSSSQQPPCVCPTAPERIAVRPGACFFSPLRPLVALLLQCKQTLFDLQLTLNLPTTTTVLLLLLPLLLLLLLLQFFPFASSLRLSLSLSFSLPYIVRDG